MVINTTFIPFLLIHYILKSGKYIYIYIYIYSMTFTTTNLIMGVIIFAMFWCIVFSLVM
jgi:hypothetical protein